MAVNEIPQPGITTVAEQRDTEILYSMEGLDIHGGTLAQDATAGPNSDGVIPPGTLMGRITASGKYVEYDEAGTDDGRRVAVCFTRIGVDVSAGDVPCPLIFGGRLKSDKLLGVDANGRADIVAKLDTVRKVLSF
jgi:hypothetical protein